MIVRVGHSSGRQNFSGSIKIAWLDQDSDATEQLSVKRLNAEGLLIWNRRGYACRVEHGTEKHRLVQPRARGRFHPVVRVAVHRHWQDNRRAFNSLSRISAHLESQETPTR